MRTGLIIAALVSGLVATTLGFGLIDDADWLEDFGGWLALTVTLYVAAALPFDRYHRSSVND